ncbi:MAG: hypothetical protein ACLFVG_10705 [Candidatus Aminicenantes bacterium]
MMDACLSPSAYQSLEALSLLPSSSRPDGILIGHQRGHRYFVEKALPLKKGLVSSPQYFDLDQLYEGRLIGFFSFRPDQKKIKKIMMPFAYGKLFLQVLITSSSKMAIRSFMVDYKEKFFLSPIPLKGSGKK